MTSRERIAAACAHTEADTLPVDFGGGFQTGIHVSIVYQLRQALGLDPPGTPVKVVEPYQMLGEIAPDLAAALGVDTVSLHGTGTMFGFQQLAFKPWQLVDGTPVLVPEDFNTDARAQRRPAAVARERPLGAAQRPDADGRLFLRRHRPPGADRRDASRPRRQHRGVQRRWPTTNWRTIAALADRLCDDDGPGAVLQLRRPDLRRHRAGARRRG